MLFSLEHADVQHSLFGGFEKHRGSGAFVEQLLRQVALIGQAVGTRNQTFCYWDRSVGKFENALAHILLDVLLRKLGRLVPTRK